MSSKIPPLLEPCLGLPEEASLTILTNMLGASSNWLVLRYLYSILQSGQSAEASADEKEADSGVVLGLDLDGSSRAGKFSFVDGLTGLLSEGQGSESTADRGRILNSGKLDDIRRGIEAAIGDVRSGSKVLIVDQLDELLALFEEEGFGQKGVTGLALEEMLLSLRERVHATVLTLSADEPLLSNQTTSFERSQAALVLAQAHAADVVLSLRKLNTGVAKDVSGVVRVTKREKTEESAEYLYHVGADGNVKVFERGA
ncbi:hypothetical protein ACHAQJ_003426 [Trichoderma viride]